MSTNSIKPVESRVGPTKTKSGNVARDNQSSLNSSSSSAKVERLCFKEYIFCEITRIISKIIYVKHNQEKIQKLPNLPFIVASGR